MMKINPRNGLLYDPADYYKYQIVPSVASNNLTVALKNYAGNDPSTLIPVKIQIGNTIRTITSSCSITINAGSNWFNAGSSELATQSVNYFVYLSTSGGPAIARIPYATSFADNLGWEKLISNTGGFVNTDKLVLIGRFSATLSAGAGYTWSLPNANVINYPIYETGELDFTPTLGAISPLTYTSTSVLFAKYKIVGKNMFVKLKCSGTTGGTTGPIITSSLPFSPSFTHQIQPVLLYNGGADDILGYAKNSSTVGEVRFEFYNSTNWALGTGNIINLNGNYFI